VGGTAALIEIAGYVALLLWGLHMVQTGIVGGLGGRLRNDLRVMLGDRFRAFGSALERVPPGPLTTQLCLPTQVASSGTGSLAV
jgi:hypothetical protein